MGMSFLLYLLSFIVVTTGLAWVATLLGVAQHYVTAGALALLAIGLVLSIARAREQTSSPSP